MNFKKGDKAFTIGYITLDGRFVKPKEIKIISVDSPFAICQNVDEDNKFVKYCGLNNLFSSYEEALKVTFELEKDSFEQQESYYLKVKSIIEDLRKIVE